MKSSFLSLSSAAFDPVQDFNSVLEPLNSQIADVEENIKSIVRRNDVVDGEFQGMKTDILSLSEKILAIKVSGTKL